MGKKSPKGYLLVIIRKEKSRYLCVRAELIMGEKGPPDFKVIDEQFYLTKQKALEQIKDWK